MLATSREPLGIARELVFSLSPLSLPEAGGHVAAVVRSGAGRLFVDRAAAADPSFALTPSTARAVVRICRQLDGVPLALGLAAARVESLAPGEIADGLSRRTRLAGASDGSALPQHHSVQASLDWSYELLDEPERVLFRRLPGAGIRRPRPVALPDATETEVSDMLLGLEAKGLLCRWRQRRRHAESRVDSGAVAIKCDVIPWFRRPWVLRRPRRWHRGVGASDGGPASAADAGPTQTPAYGH